jgi:hypothetical protein
MHPHPRQRRSRDGPIITRNGTDIRRVLASDKRRAEGREELERDFDRIRLDQDQQAHSDSLLDQLCDLIGLSLAPSELNLGRSSNGILQHGLEQEDTSRRPPEQVPVA